MRGNEVARMLGGSIAIYVVMAACSAASGPQSTSSNDGGGGGGSSSGATGDGSGGILDALTDPVTEAQAAPITATETCTGTWSPGSGLTCFYAEHAFTGYTAAQLAFVVADVHLTSTASIPPGYADEIVTPFVRDGFVSVACACGSAPDADLVTFYLPQ